MTLHRLTIDLSFTEEDPINDILDKALDHIGASCTYRPGQENEERGFIRWVECGHADNPNESCTLREEHLSPLGPCPAEP